MSVFKVEQFHRTRPDHDGPFITKKANEQEGVRWYHRNTWYDVFIGNPPSFVSTVNTLQDVPIKAVWPKGLAAKGSPVPKTKVDAGLVYLVRTQGQNKVAWGIKRKVFSEKEVLAWLVERGILPSDWRTRYQARMRNPQDNLASLLEVIDNLEAASAQLYHDYLDLRTKRISSE